MFVFLLTCGDRYNIMQEFTNLIDFRVISMNRRSINTLSKKTA